MISGANNSQKKKSNAQNKTRKMQKEVIAYSNVAFMRLLNSCIYLYSVCGTHYMKRTLTLKNTGAIPD